LVDFFHFGEKATSFVQLQRTTDFAMNITFPSVETSVSALRAVQPRASNRLAWTLHAAYSMEKMYEERVGDWPVRASWTGESQRAVRMWLVDDDDRIRELLKALLEGGTGLECERDFNSAEALLEALAKETPPDVILSDIQMGGMSGLDAIGPMRKLAPSTGVVLMTTFYDPEREARAFQLGASAFVLKRSEISEIVEQIHKAVRPAAREAESWRAEKAAEPEWASPLSLAREQSPKRARGGAWQILRELLSNPPPQARPGNPCPSVADT
jgi:DNA-binding NarL/FixJ family response regulator